MHDIVTSRFADHHRRHYLLRHGLSLLRRLLATGESGHWPHGYTTSLLLTYRAPNATMHKSTDIPCFAASQLTLLDAELQAELAETNALLASHTPTALSRAGLAILNLTVSSVRTGLGGKTVVELALDSAVVAKGATPDIPEHGIRVGDIVAVQDQPSGSAKKTEKKELAVKGAAGVVLRVRRENVEIVLDKEDADVPGGAKLWMSVAFRDWNWL